MPPDSATETPAQHHEITLVTAYFQLDNAWRSRSARDYHAWMANLLPFVRWPMVIFCDAQSVETIKRLRGDKPAVYCVTRLEDFSVYRYRDIIRAQAAARSPDSNPNTALVYGEKVNFVRRAIEMNVFGSQMFFWCDIGFFRKGKRVLFSLSKHIEWPNLRVCRAAFGTRVALFGRTLNPPLTGSPWPCGGFWGGATESLREFCDACHRCLAGRADRGEIIDYDEPTLYDAVNGKTADAHVFTTNDIGWLRRTKITPPPPPHSQFWCPIMSVRRQIFLGISRLLNCYKTSCRLSGKR